MRLTPRRQDANNPGIPGNMLNKYSYSVSGIVVESINGMNGLGLIEPIKSLNK